ncbi:MAG: site-specific integrase [Lachnospiraceae bacterium]|nr:site-specific integrase [Lachnospiraceae bacterium]
MARFTNRFGKRQTIYAKTVSDITRMLRDEQHADYKHENVADSSMTLNDWYEIWFKTCKSHCRDTTLHTYQIQYERIRELLGWRKLTGLKLVVLQEAFNELKSDASRSDCKALLIDILNRAVESELIPRHAAYGINTTIQNRIPEEKRILSDTEIATLMAVKKSEQLQNFLIVGLGTGMRMGEILGLTWDCVDFNEGIIRVEKTLCYLPNDGDAIYEFHHPKTKAGRRSIPMTTEVRTALERQLNWKKHVEIRHNPRESMENLVFCSKTNNPIHETNVRRALNEIVDKINRENPEANFERFTPHGLRHTFATKAIARGMKPKNLQKLLGHNSLQMTMDLYCHVEEETLKSEMALMEKMV